MPERNRNVVVALSGLLVAQVLHVVATLAPGSTTTIGGELGRPLGLLGLAANIVALVACVRGARWSRALAAVTGAVVAVGFLAYHGLPFDVAGLNNPYWGSGSATVLEWITVLLAMGAGVWCVWAAREVEPAHG